MADQASISYRGTRITFEVGPGQFRVVDPFVDLDVDAGAPGSPDWLWIAQGLRSLHQEQPLAATDIPRLAEDFESILDVPDISVLRPPTDRRRLQLLLFNPDERVRDWAKSGLATASPSASPSTGNGGTGRPDKSDWTQPAGGGAADWAPAKPVWSSTDPRAQEDAGFTGASRGGPTGAQLPPPMEGVSGGPAYGGGYGGYGTGYGNYGYGSRTPIQITNYLPWGIAVTLLCCLIGGIVTIVYASQANSAAAVGDPSALEKEQKAKNWLIGSGVLGIIGNAIYLFVVLGSASSTKYRY